MARFGYGPHVNNYLYAVYFECFNKFFYGQGRVANREYGVLHGVLIILLKLLPSEV